MNKENQIAALEGLAKEMAEALDALKKTTHNNAANASVAQLTGGNKLVALEGFINEMTTALAELVEVTQGSGASTTEISTTLVEMLGVMREAPAAVKPDFGVITDAIGKLRLQVDATTVDNHITVQPAVVQVIPGERSLVDYEMSVEYDQHNRITKTRLTAHPRKK